MAEGSETPGGGSGSGHSPADWIPKAAGGGPRATCWPNAARAARRSPATLRSPAARRRPRRRCGHSRPTWQACSSACARPRRRGGGCPSWSRPSRPLGDRAQILDRAGAAARQAARVRRAAAACRGRGPLHRSGTESSSGDRAAGSASQRERSAMRGSWPGSSRAFKRELAEAEQAAAAELAAVRRAEGEFQARLAELERRALEIHRGLEAERAARERAERLLESMRRGHRSVVSLVGELRGFVAKLRAATAPAEPVPEWLGREDPVPRRQEPAPAAWSGPGRGAAWRDDRGARGGRRAAARARGGGRRGARARLPREPQPGREPVALRRSLAAPSAKSSPHKHSMSLMTRWRIRRKQRRARRAPPPGRLACSPSEHPRLRPPARALRVLAARRRVQDRGPGGARRRVRPAGPRPDRPRRHERRGRALQGVRQARRQADRRL